MRRLLIAVAVVGSLAAIPASHVFLPKAHVPLNKTQVCHQGDVNGEVITVSNNATGAHLGHGDCELPACDFNNIFFTEDACSVSNAGGRCAVPNERNPADGSTPACPAGRF